MASHPQLISRRRFGQLVGGALALQPVPAIAGQSSKADQRSLIHYSQHNHAPDFPPSDVWGPSRTVRPVGAVETSGTSDIDSKQLQVTGSARPVSEIDLPSFYAETFMPAKLMPTEATQASFFHTIHKISKLLDTHKQAIRFVRLIGDADSATIDDAKVVELEQSSRLRSFYPDNYLEADPQERLGLLRALTVAQLLFPSRATLLTLIDSRFLVIETVVGRRTEANQRRVRIEIATR